MSGPRPLVDAPPGAQCFVGDEVRRRRAIESRVLSVFEGWDYEEIIPPLFDYAESFASEALAPRTYSFVGRDGSLLALRPDFTSLIAKIAAGRLAGRPTPLRLYYSGEVLRYEPPRPGRQSELYQMGLEHLGPAALAADVEVLGIAAESLEALEVRDYSLALGHVSAFAALAARSGLPKPALDALRDRVDAKDAEGARAVVEAGRVPREVGEALVALASLAGDATVLAEARRRLAAFPEAAAAVADLAAVVGALEAAGLGTHVSVDLGELRGLDYYTGLVFRLYARGLGFEVGGGGRYDSLLGRFGRPLPAVGFMLGLDRLALLLERQRLLPEETAAAAEAVGGADLGAALRSARALRGQGRRVRFDGGVA
jgi:ATP phosphoribosyltransferase regulatory subunit